ncbi:MAG: hypothetical protein ABSB32_16830 [Thermodesulfobacteriota bacterium]|jgi:hypothetical protein
MATKRSIHIWILFGILIIAAWLLGSVTQAGAQTYTLKCRETGHMPKVHVIEVGDVSGHILGVGEMAGVQSCDDGSVATNSSKWMTDLTKGSGKSQSYGLATYEDGSTTWSKGINTVTANPDGKTARWEGTFEYIKGTGRFEGIQGSGSWTGKRLLPMPGAGAQYYLDYTITYTLPSK